MTESMKVLMVRYFSDDQKTAIRGAKTGFC